jgi:hypothetical protein
MAKEGKVSKPINIDKDLMDLVDRLTVETTKSFFADLYEDDERDRQEDLAKKIKKRGIHAPPKKDEDVDEAEDEEGEEKAAQPAQSQEPEAEAKPGTIKPQEEEIEEATFDDIVSQLNMMRSGKSTKDKDVKERLETYVNGLAPGERQTLFVFLIGLTGILTGGEAAESAPDPSSIGIKVQAKRKTQDVEPELKAPQAKAATGPAAATGTKEVPIIVGEVADKKEIRRRLSKLWNS